MRFTVDVIENPNGKIAVYVDPHGSDTPLPAYGTVDTMSHAARAAGEFIEGALSDVASRSGS